MSSIDTSQTPPQKALLAAPMAAPLPATQMIVEVARQVGVSPIKQLFEMLRLDKKSGISFREYYSEQHYRTDLSKEEKQAFVGRDGSFKLNMRLSPAKLGDKRSLIRDKVLYTTLLRGMDMPTTQTQAVVHSTRGFGNIPTLRTAQQVVTFLREEAKFPIFAKPLEGSKSVGSALIRGLNASQDLIELGNGRAFDLMAFAHEIVADYPEGFTFQSGVEQHPDVTALAGAAVGTMRVVTVIEDGKPRVLYTIWKIPAPTAMSDNFWQNGSMLAAVDHQNGQVTHAVAGHGLDRQTLKQHPVSGVSFEGFQVPHWDKIVKTACEGHLLFPEFGIFGWDIAVGKDGPVIIECNANPFHTLYQIAHDRGINNPEFAPVFDKIEARGQALLKERLAELKAARRASARDA